MHQIKHDGIVHHPLGGGSYVFRKGFIRYLVKLLRKDAIKISIGAQPNSSPHFGTIVVFSLTFALAEALQSVGKRSQVVFEIVDTAPAEVRNLNGIEYQVSLRRSGKDLAFLPQYFILLDILSELTGVDFVHRRQSEFNAQPLTKKVWQIIIQHQKLVSELLDPQYLRLRFRVACPQCGLTDKKALNTFVEWPWIGSKCPIHGEFKVNILNSPEVVEYNTPLRNLVRALVYALYNEKRAYWEWIRVTGADYAGFYQEQLLYRVASLLGFQPNTLPIIVYAPLVLDWSGAKLSKSLYVSQGAYDYLPRYVLDFESFFNYFGKDGIKALLGETRLWLQEPYRLFRHYTIFYFLEKVLPNV